MTGENMLSISVANMESIYWSVRSSGWRGLMGAIVLVRCKFHFNRENENLVQDPCKNTTIL